MDHLGVTVLNELPAWHLAARAQMTTHTNLTTCKLNQLTDMDRHGSKQDARHIDYESNSRV